MIDMEVASNSHVWEKRFGTVPSVGSFAGQIASVMDGGSVSNFTLGDVKAIQPLSAILSVLDSVLYTAASPLSLINLRISF